MKLITKNEFAKATKLDKLKMPGLAELVMELTKINKVNRIFAENIDKQGLDFIDGVLEDIGVTIEFDEDDLKNIPKEGGFIALANHPYGGVEGLILVKLLCMVRPEAKVMANFLLKKIPNISDYFIGVNPFENVKSVSSMAGMKLTMEKLKENIPVGIFPAGEVSTYNAEAQTITDKKWSPIVGKLITKAQLPVVPIYFHGNNGVLFHLLGLIHPSLRTVKLPSELFNKKGTTIKLRIGKPIMPAEYNAFNTPEKSLKYLRARTYALNSSFETDVNRFFVKDLFSVLKKPEDIVEATEQHLLEQDVAQIKEEALVYTEKNYEVYIAKTQQIPNIIREIGRLREITFRHVGEGTNKKIDLDEFDLYYRHLFIWDKEAKKIVGAYRIGRGNDIFYAYGKKGFYINTLFNIKDQMNNVLKHSLELGRSFIVKEYQQKPLPLFLLWKGISSYVLKHPEFQYLIGPVSISSNFSNLSQSLIIDFITKNFYDHTLAQYVSPKTKFKVTHTNVDTDVLIEQFSSLKSLDALISEIEISNSKMPVLLRQYIQLNAKIICFNIDPKFENSLDGFLVLNLKDIPVEKMEKLSQGV
ncbi:lysophospholipid acyltransferase family protein [Solitalea sp. MAHUQ-68]|uniref:Lysophospholipid acyltransferase family protein n=1 Tax=Solitalea agri TaxID=2953739 RepID=A0A9X2F357_9SPHI|nr:lysophospholipid acyltransferase family protein [Solitalea agri]MCO4293867.1 lysophospholipid acyltransferase family protein [Solitalea agri]